MSLVEMVTMLMNYFIMEWWWRLLVISIVLQILTEIHGHGKIQLQQMLEIGFMEEMIVLIILLRHKLQVVHFH